MRINLANGFGGVRGRAQEAMRLGEWASAENLLLKLVEKEPSGPGDWISLGNAQTEQGRYAEALTSFAVAHMFAPYDVNPIFGKAGVHERKGEWELAAKCWGEARALLEARHCAFDRELTHAIHHLVLCELLSGQREMAIRTLATADHIYPGLQDALETYLLRARLLRHSHSLKALDLLSEFLAVKNDDAARYEFGSIALDSNRYHDGLAMLAASPSLARGEPSYLLLASDLAERSGQWGKMAEFRAQLVQNEPVSSIHHGKLQFAYLQIGRLAEARLVALNFVKTSGGELSLLAPLVDAYEHAGLRDRARRVARFLRRRWPHSRYNAILYIRLLGEAGRLEQADALLRSEIGRWGSSPELQRAYCEQALTTGRYSEAARRFRWFIKTHPDDLAARLGLGYALASSVGIETASQHFRDVAAETFQDPDALVGLAHMAMRVKDHRLTAERWRIVGDSNPTDPVATVERARALFNVGSPNHALSTCRSWIARHPKSLQVEEFYCWLLCATGRFKEARARAAESITHFGPSWPAARVLIEATGVLGELESTMATLHGEIPAVRGEGDIEQLYSFLRLLVYFDCPKSDLYAVLNCLPINFNLSWAHGYLEEQDSENKVEPYDRLASKARRDWLKLLGAVGSERIESWSAMDDEGLDKLLAHRQRKPAHIHIVNMFEQASGGSELHALDIGEQLRPYARVSFWAAEAPHPLLEAEHGVRGIDPSAEAIPIGGTILFVGAYYKLGPWLTRARPRRVLVLYNTFDAVRLQRFLTAIHLLCECKVELLFCSDMMRAEVRLPGVFEPSPTDLDVFRPQHRLERNGFVIGRHSRDVVEKHHPDDSRVYEALVAEGASVQLLGATCMASTFKSNPAIELLPAQRGGIPDYLATLDCFYYRTGTWIEPWGRVVIEAMAMGLPVVVHERGGYAQAVENGVDGFIFRTSEEAIDQLTALQKSTGLRTRIGANARRKAEALVGPAALQRLLAYYLL